MSGIIPIQQFSPAKYYASTVMPHTKTFEVQSALRYGRTLNVELQNLLTYGQIDIVTNLKNKATVGRISLMLGTKEILYTYGHLLEKRDDFFNWHKAEGRIVWRFTDFERNTLMSARRGEFQTFANQSVALKIEMLTRSQVGDASTHDPVESALTMSIEAQVWSTRAPLPKFQPRQYEGLKTVSTSANRLRLDFPDASPNLMLYDIMFDESEVTIKKIWIKDGNTVVDELTRSTIEFMQSGAERPRKQISGFLVLDFMLLNGYSPAKNSARLNFEMDITGTGALPFYVNGYEKLN